MTNLKPPCSCEETCIVCLENMDELRAENERLKKRNEMLHNNAVTSLWYKQGMAYKAKLEKAKEALTQIKYQHVPGGHDQNTATRALKDIEGEND